MKKHIFLIGSFAPFLLLKITNLGIRLSDTNIYFNIAYRITHGQLPYKDFFFANFPIFAYISSFYFLIIGGNINLFYFTSIVEALVVALFIYKISFEKTKSYLISLTSCLFYIYSFIILSTSDHQTGVFSASLFAVLAYYFFQRKKIFICGIFVGLSFLTKAYFIPILLSFIFYLLLKRKWKELKLFSFGLTTIGIIVLTPFLIFAQEQFLSNIFGFSLTRPAGVSKIDISWFFILKDFLLFILLIFNLINIKKNLFFFLISLFSIVFFFYYQDAYYLYLNFMIPFLCMSFYEINHFLKNTFKIPQSIILTIIFFFISLNVFIYANNYKNLQKIHNIDEIISTIKNCKPTYLYGYNGLTPALSVVTNVPALLNVNDAYVYFFRKGIYDKEVLTSKAISTKTIIITQGADYSGINIKQDILDNEILNEKKVYEKCKNILSVPVRAEGLVNRINLFKCY